MEEKKQQPAQKANKKTNETEGILYSGNKSYLFIPFSYTRGTEETAFEQADFETYVNALHGSELWVRKKMHINYLLKYITGKFDISLQRDNTSVVWDSTKMPALAQKIRQNRGYALESDTAALNFDEVQCFHFVLNIKAFEQQSCVKFFENYPVFCYYKQIKEGAADFMFTGAEMFCFNTIGILAIQIEFSTNVPIQISNAQYMLKNAERAHVIVDPQQYEKNRNSGKMSMVDIFKSCIQITDQLHYELFFYANENTARANMLTLIEVPEKEDYDRDLFYLKKCYSDGYLYTQTPEDNDEIYCASKDVIWGLSTEAAVCLICPDMGRERFLKGSFFKNFQTQYLFMYIFLLHQKYVLYKFLTDINVRSSKDLETLEQYKDRLYRFETDFVFSRITEVPQYQNIYNRIMKVFSLKEMYEDVHEPLISLSEVRYKADEEAKQKHDKRITLVLFLLSLLSIFSAWIDSFDFFGSFFSKLLPLSEPTIAGIQWAFLTIITVGSGILIFLFFHSPKNKK